MIIVGNVYGKNVVGKQPKLLMALYIGKKIENAVHWYFNDVGLPDPTANFQWEYILIDNDKIKNAWCMPGGKIAVYTGILEVTKKIELI